MNVQHSLPSTSIPFSGTSKDASEIIAKISTFEDNLQSSLKEVFNSFQKDALKVVFYLHSSRNRISVVNFLIQDNISNGIVMHIKWLIQ